MPKLLQLFFLFFFIPAYINAQLQHIKFERITANQGLSKSEVTCIFQDSNGFIWVGSELGVKKYDGYKFNVYKHDPENPYSLSNDNVRGIIEDKSGAIWIATFYGGINRFDRVTERFFHYGLMGDNLQEKKELRIYANIEDRRGKIWIGTNIGLCYFDPEINTVNRYSENSSIHEKLVNSVTHVLYEDVTGTIWIGTKNVGLFSFDPVSHSFKNFHNDPHQDNSLSANRIESITEDNCGHLFIGTRNGLNKFDRERNIFTRYFYQSVNNKIGEQNWIRAICPADANLLWIATSKGLGKFDHENDKVIDIFNGTNKFERLKSQSIKKLYKDRRGILWVSTYSGELFKYDPNRIKFRKYVSDPQNPTGLSNNFLYGIYKDSYGSLWVGTYGGGLYELTASQAKKPVPEWIHYGHEPNNPKTISDDGVYCIYEDSEKTLWIGTECGLNKLVRIKNGSTNTNQYQQKYFIRYLNGSGTSSNNSISCIFEDKKNHLWLGTDNGLYQFDRSTNSFIHIISTESLGGSSISYILESSKGQMWLATMWGGLYKYNPETGDVTRHYIDPENPYSEQILTMKEDKFGYLWIATKKGLYKYDPNKGNFIHFNNKYGLPEDDIYAILDDSEGNLWLSSVHGIFRFSPESGEVKSFDTDDGLNSMEFNVLSYHKDKQGWMYFGGINGLTAFHPDSIKYNLNIPDIIITDFRIFNKSIIPGKDSPLEKSISEENEIILPYDQSIFSFEFAALDYTNPSKNRYAYKMEGVDPDWVYTDASRRFATYTNLDPGEYTFQVKGSNNDGIWNEEGTSIKVIINPPWWATNWAYAFYLFLFGSVVILTWRAQIRRIHIKQQLQMEHFEAEKLREVDQLKSRFFANISHEFRTPLTLILGPVKQMLAGQFIGNIKEQYKMIIRNGERLLKLINELLDLSKLESGEIKLQVSETDILKYLKGIVLSFSSLAESKKVTLKFTEAENSFMGFVDRDKLEKIVTNLLSNAFKFTPEGGAVEVSITPLLLASPLTKGGMGEVQISISNTGPGIPADQINKIFDRFYQAGDNYKKDNEGTGIGLALTKELVEVCRGEIKVESIPNKTTAFTLTLPIAKEQFKEDEIVKSTPLSPPLVRGDSWWVPEGTQDSPLKKGVSGLSKSAPLLLIVEDNPDVTNYICSFMENDYHVITAENGKEGLKKTLEKFPDLVISDVMMPEMDGFELCQKIKSDERVSHIPVILLTAKADLDSKINGLEFGADDYVTKPFEARELQIRSKNLIEQRRKLREKFSLMMDLKPEDIAASSMDEQLLQRLLNVFEEHIEEPEFSVEQLAKEIGMSRRHLNRKIQAITNLSTTDFIRTLRLQKAAFLLKNASDTVSEIAYKVGFNNLSYFSRAFRKHFGKLPSDFSNQQK